MNQDDEQILVAISGRQAGATGWVRVNCPLCFDRFGAADARQSLGVRMTNGYWHCFRCLQSGRVDVGASTVPGEERVELPDEIEPPDDFYPLFFEPGRSAEVLAPARRYLRSRGVGEDVWRAAAIGAVAEGWLRQRVVVPIFSDTGEDWAGWVARDWTGASRLPKYLYAKGMRRAELLYGQRCLGERTDEPALVVEGIFDALPYWGRAVALLGKPSAKQVERLAHSWRPLVVALDGDSHEESWALARRLCLLGARAFHVKLPPGEDPGSVEPQWLLAQATQLTEGN